MVDAAMVDGAASQMAPLYSMFQKGGWRLERGTNLLDGAAPFYRCYECSDGGYIAAARRLNVSTDWRAVRPGDAAFSAMEFAPGLYMQALVALGYCAARLGQDALAEEALGKAAEIDPADRFGGAWMLRHMAERAAAEADDPA